MLLFDMVDFKSLTSLEPLQENNPLTLTAAYQLLFLLLHFWSCCLSTVIFHSDQINRIDSKTETCVRIMVYRPWLGKSLVQKEILKERNPIFLLVHCSVCACSEIAGMKAAPGSVFRVIVWSRGAWRPRGCIRFWVIVDGPWKWSRAMCPQAGGWWSVLVLDEPSPESPVCVFIAHLSPSYASTQNKNK